MGSIVLQSSLFEKTERTSFKAAGIKVLRIVVRYLTVRTFHYNETFPSNRLQPGPNGKRKRYANLILAIIIILEMQYTVK